MFLPSSEGTENINELIDPDDQLINGIYPDNDINNSSNYYSLHNFNSLQLPPTQNLSLFNCNIRSFSKNGASYETLLQSMTHKPSFLVLSETWNTPDSAQLCRLDGYDGVHVCRNRIVHGGGVGGGVSVFFSSHFSGDRADEISFCDSTIEICSCRIYIDNSYILILGIYRPHTDTISNFNCKLQDILNHNITKNAALLLVSGDININMCDPAVSESYTSLMLSYNFLPAITRPTRFSQAHNPNIDAGAPGTSNQSMNSSFLNFTNCSNLDHIWVGKIEQFTSGILLFDLSDHLPTFVFFHHRSNSQNNEKIVIKTRPFSENNLISLINDIKHTNMDVMLLGEGDSLDVHNSCHNFCTYLDNIYCKNFPLKTKYVSEKRICKPWLDSNLKKLINKKSEYLKKFRLGLISKETNNLIRNEVNIATRAAKNNYYRTAYSAAKNDMKKSWAITKKLLGTNSKKQNIAKLIINNVEYTEPSDIADQFNVYFSSVAEQLDALLPPSDFNMSDSSNVNSFYLFPQTVDECNKIIRKLKLTKTSIDSMPVFILKKISDLIAPTLCKLINLSYNEGVFPNCLKVARITPVYKKGDKSNPSNHRPIASLHYISKVYERSMANRLINFLDKFSIISLSQFGFQRNKSTTDAIEHLTEFIYSNLSSKKSTVNVLIDLRKAFDTVNHIILLYKLHRYGIRGVPHHWFASYLRDRHQYVSLGPVSSTIKPINIGVPQGSILGPILFLLFINDLPSCTENLRTTLFADDTTLSIANEKYDHLVPVINRELSNVQNWLGKNRLSINIEKTELMIITNKRNTNHNDDQITFHNEYLKFTECSMFLGLKLDNKLKFADNINILCGKIAKNIGIFSKIRHNLPEKARINFYFGFIFPYLSQNIIIWGKTYDCHLEPLIVLQKRMIRLITDSEYLEHTNPLFYQLKLLKFNDIYKYFASIYMHKSLKLGKYQTQHSLNTRNRDLAQSVTQRLTQGQQSIAHMGPQTWNSLPVEIRRIDDLRIFKLRLKSYLINQYSP